MATKSMSTICFPGNSNIFEITDKSARESIADINTEIKGIKNDIDQIEQNGGSGISVLTSPDGSVWHLTISNNGTITAIKEGAFESFVIFVPENVSDEWNTGGVGSSTQAKTLNISTTEFLELFYDDFVATPPDGIIVTKTSIGKDESNTYDMWEYDFCPTSYERTILLSSGMHTYELGASFGLANFIGHLYNDTDNSAFDYIRKNVRIKIIPVINPWGFNQNPKTYGNVNGVNPNRNFDYNGGWSDFPVYTPSENEWNVKGDYPFSEVETQNLANWVLDNWNAEFWIDCHTGLGYSDKDLWIYYQSDSVILDRINGSVSKIEAWFAETYGTTCVTTRSINDAGSIRQEWSNKVAGIPTMTLEQAPGRTTFGTSSNNDAGDISNYSTNISTFVQEFLLEKYRDTSIVKISNVSASDITIGQNELSKTVEVTITPTDTTQNHFVWTSSNESVVVVYGGTNKAILVNKGTGTATITLENRYDSTIKTSFNVTVSSSEYYSVTNDLSNVTTNNSVTDVLANDSYTATLTPDNGYNIANVTVTMGRVDITSTVYTDGVINIQQVTGDLVITAKAVSNIEIGAQIKAISASTGFAIESTARIATDFISVTPSETCSIASEDGYYIKAFTYDKNKILLSSSELIGNLSSVSASGILSSECYYVRIVLKKTTGSDFTETELNTSVININNVPYRLVKSEETEPTSYNIVLESGTIDVNAGTEIENTARIRTGFIPFDGNVTIEPDVGDMGFVFRAYNATKAYVSTGSYDGTKNSSGWYVSGGALTGGITGFFRMVLINADNSDITLPIEGSITVDGIVYNFVSE